jgi:hypothetical protein
LAIYSIGFVIPEQRKESIEFFFGKWSFTRLLFILMFAFVPSLCLFYYFDNRVKVRIDGDGIWSHKYGSVSWNDIWYFNSSIYKFRSDGDLNILHVRLKDTDDRLNKDVTINFRRMDKSFDEVRIVIQYYAIQHKILDLGNESQT